MSAGGTDGRRRENIRIGGRWNHYHKTRIHAVLHGLKVCFPFISPQRAKRHCNLNFASVVMQYLINCIFLQQYPPPAALTTPRGHRSHIEQPGAGCEVKQEGRQGK